ncbi:MAG: hypothetical protein KKB74_13745 [Bacteroidetes bacterium]|nr:hypothetical protein [Bacteroidota bacterium]
MTFKKLIGLFTRKHTDTTPLIIIRKSPDDAHVTEFNSIEEAIVSLENDPNISAEKIEVLRSSLKILKNKSSIKIKNGEIVK